MARPKPCLGCRRLTTNTRCATCTAQRDKARGTTSQRGYGSQHQRLREQVSAVVRSGNAICWRCQQPIDPTAAWDLGHDTDRTKYRGPEHAACNRATATHKHPGGGSPS
jgi:hypothetical protein